MDEQNISSRQDQQLSAQPEMTEMLDGDVVVGGVPVPEKTGKEKEKLPAEEKDWEKAAPRRRKRPAMATLRQKLTILILGLVLAFLLGIFAGVLLAYGCWRGEPSSQPGTVQDKQPANQIPDDTEDTKSADETAELTGDTAAATGEQTEPETEPQTEPETEPQTEPETAPTADGGSSNETAGYFFHDSNSRYLTYEDYKDLSWWHLILARNEIFARHGRRFVNDEIQAYFDGCAWYRGTIAPEDFDSSVLNDYEVKNVYILKDAAEAR